MYISPLMDFTLCENILEMISNEYLIYKILIVAGHWSTRHVLFGLPVVWFRTVLVLCPWGWKKENGDVKIGFHGDFFKQK